jgi:hypothetical protein
MKNINIKPVNHGTTKADKNRYCGPSAISIITGMTTACFATSVVVKQSKAHPLWMSRPL